MVFFPAPLLFNSLLPKGLVARNTGCPLWAELIIMISATLFHLPCGLLTWVPHHFSQPSPSYDQHPIGNLLAYVAKCKEFAIQFSSLPGVLQIMSLYIDMKMILPWNCSGSHFNLLNFVVNSQCSESWEIFSTRIPSVLCRSIQIFETACFQIPFGCSRLELVLDWCLPNIAPSQQRRRFGILKCEQLISL